MNENEIGGIVINCAINDLFILLRDFVPPCEAILSCRVMGNGMT